MSDGVTHLEIVSRFFRVRDGGAQHFHLLSVEDAENAGCEQEHNR